MKLRSFIILFFAQLIVSSAIGQQQTCKSLQTGNFRVVTKEAGTTIISRTKDEQFEKNDDLGYEMIFSLTWIDECTYELRPKKLIKGDPAIMGDGTHFVRTRIKDISESTYVAETTGSFGDMKLDFLVEIIK